MDACAVAAAALLLVALGATQGADERSKDERSPAVIVRELIDAAGAGGEARTDARGVKEVDEWVRRNGESIRGTTAGPLKKLSYGACTRNGEKLYVHVFDWPKNGVLVVPVLNTAKKAYLLADEATALETYTDDVGRVRIKVPGEAPDAIATVVVLEIEGEPVVVGGGKVIAAGVDGSLTLLAIDAEVVGRRAKLERKGQNPHNIGYWTDVKDYVQWEVVIDRAGKYEVELEYSAAPNSGGSEYAIEVMGEVLKSKIEATKSFLDFKTIVVGTVEVKKSGKGTVVVRPVTKPGVAVMDLRKIVMRRR